MDLICITVQCTVYNASPLHPPKKMYRKMYRKRYRMMKLKMLCISSSVPEPNNFYAASGKKKIVADPVAPTPTPT
jgi:hypothetical protein